MQLLYIWVENYKDVFINQEFNFGTDETVTYNKEVNTLIVETKKNHIKNFFGKQISNITALIGENGAGKSTTLDIIKEFFNDPFALLKGSESSKEQNYIFFFKDKNDYYLHYTKASKPILKNSKGEEIFSIPYDIKLKRFDDIDALDVLYKTHKIYFSNVFTSRILDVDTLDYNVEGSSKNYQYIHNKTTDRLLYVNPYKYSNNLLYHANMFQANEIKNQIRFLCSSEYNKIKTKLSNIKEFNCLKIKIDNNNMDFPPKGHENIKQVFINYEEALNEIITVFDTLTKQTSFRIQFLKNLIINYFNNLLSDNFTYFFGEGNYNLDELCPIKFEEKVNEWEYDNLYINVETFFLKCKIKTKIQMPNKDENLIAKKNNDIVNSIITLIKTSAKLDKYI